MVVPDARRRQEIPFSTVQPFPIVESRLLKRINIRAIHLENCFPQPRSHMISSRWWTFALGLLAYLFLTSSLSLAQTPSRSHPASAAVPNDAVTYLRNGWTVQTSAKVEAKGETISTAKFAPAGWHQASVPSTVVAALVKDKTLPDPFFGMNLRQFPGVSYPIGGNFSNIAMQTDSPYAVSWWYRRQFE